LPYRYNEDDISPEDPLFEEGYRYEILSKNIKLKPNKTGDASKSTVWYFVFHFYYADFLLATEILSHFLYCKSQRYK
jgi:hypothetical protein